MPPTAEILDPIEIYTYLDDTWLIEVDQNTDSANTRLNIIGLTGKFYM